MARHHVVDRAGEVLGIHAETFDGVLDLSADLAEAVRTHNKARRPESALRRRRRQGRAHRRETATDAYADADHSRRALPRALGGMDLPSTISRASMAWFQAANPAPRRTRC